MDRKKEKYGKYVHISFILIKKIVKCLTKCLQKDAQIHNIFCSIHIDTHRQDIDKT